MEEAIVNDDGRWPMFTLLAAAELRGAIRKKIDLAAGSENVWELVVPSI